MATSRAWPLALLILTALVAAACTSTDPRPGLTTDASRQPEAATSTSRQPEAATSTSRQPEAATSTSRQPDQAAVQAPELGSTEGASERRIIAGVNHAIADVDLNDIVFDTFDGGSISLADAEESQILALLNTIRPLDDPVYMAGEDAAWVTDDELVLGYIADDGTAWAHPHRVLNFHEIVNTELGGRPVAITYCPLCGSGIVFDRRPNDLRHDGVLSFDNTSALYENDMVMVDEQTHTYWWQVGGRGIVGNLTGTELTLLPSMTATWRTWLSLHPHTVVLSNDQGSGPAYFTDPFAGYANRLDRGQTPFPTSPEAFADDRLSPSIRVLGFDLAGDPAAIAVLGDRPAVIEIEEADLVAFVDGQGGAALYSSLVDGTPARFTVENDRFVDLATGSRWDAAGRAVEGPHAGTHLEPQPSRVAFWFSWVSTVEGQRTRLLIPTAG